MNDKLPWKFDSQRCFSLATFEWFPVTVVWLKCLQMRKSRHSSCQCFHPLGLWRHDWVPRAHGEILPCTQYRSILRRVFPIHNGSSNGILLVYTWSTFPPCHPHFPYKSRLKHQLDILVGWLMMWFTWLGLGWQAAPLWTMFYPAEPASTFPEDVPWKTIFAMTSPCLLPGVTDLSNHDGLHVIGTFSSHWTNFWIWQGLTGPFALFVISLCSIPKLDIPLWNICFCLLFQTWTWRWDSTLLWCSEAMRHIQSEEYNMPWRCGWRRARMS